MTALKPVKLSYKIFEPTSGTHENLSPIIFLHGMTCTKEMWEDIPQMVAEETKRKVYTYDARNHGDSEYTDFFHFSHNIEDLFTFMDNMDIKRATLIGHSMGGLTATHAALTKPEKVEMVISEDMFIKKIPKGLLEPGIMFLKLLVEGVKAVPKDCTESEAFMCALKCMNKQLPEGEVYSQFKDMLKDTKFNLKRNQDGSYAVSYNHEILIKTLENVENLMDDPPPGIFEGPALFVYGGQSPFHIGNEKENIRKQFPNAEFTEIPEANHNVHIDYPEKFSNIILHYLKNMK